MEFRQTHYKGWEAWRACGDRLALTLVPQVGGRIMGMLWDEEELAFTQPVRAGQVLDLSAVKDLAAFKQQLGFPLWGGDKTWLAPQARWKQDAPFLDLDSGPYTLTVLEQSQAKVVIRMVSGVCRETQMRIERTVTAEGDRWSTHHRLVNCSDKLVE